MKKIAALSIFMLFTLSMLASNIELYFGGEKCVNGESYMTYASSQWIYQLPTEPYYPQDIERFHHIQFTQQAGLTIKAPVGTIVTIEVTPGEFNANPDFIVSHDPLHLSIFDSEKVYLQPNTSFTKSGVLTSEDQEASFCHIHNGGLYVDHLYDMASGVKPIELEVSVWDTNNLTDKVSVTVILGEYPVGEFYYVILSEQDRTCMVTGWQMPTDDTLEDIKYGAEVNIPEKALINDKVYTVTKVSDNLWSYGTPNVNFVIPESVQIVPLSYRIVSETEATCEVESCINPDPSSSIASRFSHIEVPQTTEINGKNYTIIGIGSAAFANNNMQSVNLPETLEYISSSAFYCCRNLTSINIPESLTSVDNAAFYDCNGLNSTLYNSTIFVRLPTSYEGEYAIPEGISKIAPYAFHGCSGLTSVIIPNTVKNLDYWVFSGCSMPNITIPESVESINIYAIRGCEGLQSLTMQSPIPPTLVCDSEYNNENDWLYSLTLYVPRGSIDAYKADATWSKFGSIEEYEVQPDYEFTAENIMARKGRITMLPVTMNNVGGIVSFQCDVTLPDGVTVHQEDGVYAIEASDRFDNTHSISASMQGGKLRIVSFSISNHAYKGNDGVLFSIPIEVSDNLADGQECELVISNIMLTKADLTNYDAEDVKVQITVGKKFVPGDVNDDGRYTILDASMVIAYILGQDPANGIKDAADVNGDGKITVLDASLVVSYVLDGKPVNAAAKAPADDAATTTAEQTTIRFEDGKAYVSIPDASRFVAGQLELALPECAEIESIDLVGENADSHSLAWRKGDNGVINLATYSLSNSPLSGEDLIEIAFANNCHAGEIVVSNVLMTSTDNDYYEEMAFAPAYATIGTDGIVNAIDGFTVFTEGHNLVIISDKPMTLTLSSVDGKCRTIDVAHGKNTYPLNSGYYIINNHKFYIR